VHFKKKVDFLFTIYFLPLLFSISTCTLAGYGSLTRTFSGFTGTIRLLWLPYSNFLWHHGHHPTPMFTLLELSLASQAPSDSYGYLARTFAGFTGTIRLLWFPCSNFLWHHGHHPTPMFTLLELSLASQAPSDSYGYLARTFAGFTGTIRLLWLPYSNFLWHHGHHSPPYSA
jgi:hypothetical protein